MHGRTRMLDVAKHLAIDLFVGFSVLAICGISLADDEAGNDTRQEIMKTSESAASTEETEENGARPTVDREARIKLKLALEALRQEQCRKKGMVSYHGQCMTAEDQAARFEFDVKHAENLLSEAIRLYKTDSPQEVGWMFQRAKEFVGEFDEDAIMDRQLAERVLPLLGFIYLAADRLAGEMKQNLSSRKTSDDPFMFLDDRAEMESFLSNVYVPIVKLFGEQIDTYISLYGRHAFAKLMFDNGLKGVLDGLERSGS